MRRIVLSAVALLVCALPALARAEGPGIDVHAGWWSLEAEYRTGFGLFAAAGTPWVVGAASLLDGSDETGVGGKLGWQFDLSRETAFRVGVRGAFGLGQRYCRECLDPRRGYGISAMFGALEAGLRWRRGSGFVAGIDLPMFALYWGGGDFGIGGPPPMSLLFSQAYVGWTWDL